MMATTIFPATSSTSATTTTASSFTSAATAGTCSPVQESLRQSSFKKSLYFKGSAGPLPPEDPKAALAAFTVPGQADAVSADIDRDLKESGTHDMTAKFGPRLIKKERCDYLRPTVILNRRSVANDMINLREAVAQ